MSRLRRIAATTLVGLLATLAWLFTPLLGSIAPIVPPYVPIDLRFVFLPLIFGLWQTVSELLAWPAPATASLGSATLAAIVANLHASQVLAYLGVPWARGGMEIDLVTMAFSLAAILLALWITFDAARERFEEDLLERGLAPAQLAGIDEQARGLGREAIALAGLAAAGLALLARVLATVLGDQALPLAELAAILLVLGAGALLLGIPGRKEAA